MQAGNLGSHVCIYCACICVLLFWKDKDVSSFEINKDHNEQFKMTSYFDNGKLPHGSDSLKFGKSSKVN